MLDNVTIETRLQTVEKDFKACPHYRGKIISTMVESMAAKARNNLLTIEERKTHLEQLESLLEELSRV